MASVDINYNCGCGHSTKDLEAAKEHADSTGHSLTVCGSIKAPKIVKELKAAAKTTSKAIPRHVPEPPAIESEIFTGLRSKLGRAKGSD